MSYNYNNQYNRHNSIGGNWKLPPINGYNQPSPPTDPNLNLNRSEPPVNNGNNQMPGFRNPWYYSNQSPSLSSPTNTSHSPTKLQSSIPLLQQQSQKRLSFANQLPTTYESDARRPSNATFVHPPTRADNPFNQYYGDADINNGPERRMSVAVDNLNNKTDQYSVFDNGNISNANALHHNQTNPAMNPGYNNRRSSVAVAGFQHQPAYVNDSRLNNYYAGSMRFNRSQSIVQYNQYQQILQNQKLTNKRNPAPKLSKVYNRLDLKPKSHPQPKYRRCSVNSIHISPANALSVYLTESYSICQPKKFQYSKATNPKRVLTKPSEPKFNNGFDNESSDYILYVNDILGTDEGRKYIVLDLLGSGTFGQVVKCQNLSNQSIVAVKVIKSQSAYMNQSLTEVRILEYLNNNSDGRYFIKLLDTFIHKEHLCLVFEILASNLYELIKQNQFHGLNMKLVKVLTRQLLESMAQLKNFQMIHCDLKPENILLCQHDKPDIKVIDFGSTCFNRETVYSYVQSRFYRSPEVILGLPYTESIDMWSVGCIVGELFLGLPLFPGHSEYNQIMKIVDMLGLPPRHMIEVGKNSMNFFKKIDNGPDKKPDYRLASYDEYIELLKRNNKTEKLKNEHQNKNFFKQKLLKDIILQYRLPSKKMTNTMVEKECEERLLLVDFLTKILNMNPLERLTPQEALKHPFIRNVDVGTNQVRKAQVNEA